MNKDDRAASKLPREGPRPGRQLFGARERLAARGGGPALARRLLDDLDERLRLDGLGEVAQRPFGHGSGRRGQGRVPRHEDERQVAVERPHAPQELHAGHPRHVEVRQHDVERGAPDRVERGEAPPPAVCTA